MASHEGHDHPNTKAARAACRRGKGANALPPTSAEDKARIKAGRETPSQVLRQPHAFAPLEHRPVLCKHCAQTERGRLHDGVVGESRLHTAQAACAHPAADWVLKGSTRKRARSYYCRCGKHMGDKGPEAAHLA